MNPLFFWLIVLLILYFGVYVRYNDYSKRKCKIICDIPDDTDDELESSVSSSASLCQSHYSASLVMPLLPTKEMFTKHTFKFKYRNKAVELYNDDEEGIQIMKDLIDDMNRLVDYCVENEYPSAHESRRLSQNWSTVPLRQTSYKDHVAYVTNKNENFKLCFVNPDGEYENTNTMRFVVIHELSHMMSESFGHNDEFSDNFLKLLRVAIQLKIYDVEDFKHKPKRYCDYLISSSPCSKKGACEMN
uniref:WLM domain-containing protein n=1 Tax=viral metagenome TaxID=1070528 RepID=A0A6C0CT08_9ZZZZ